MKDYATIDVVLPGYALGTNQGRVAFCGVYLVEGADRDGQRKRILVDLAHVGRRPVLQAALAQRGLAPTDIDLVVLTHAHWDHVQNLDLFAHAPHLLHPDERRYARRPHQHDWATPQWTGTIIEQLQVREVAEGAELLRGVTVVDLVGHSAGSIGLAVETERGLSVITGDALARAYEAQTRENPLVFWSVERARRSIERVVEMADVIYPGHDRAFRLSSSGEIEYQQPFQLVLSGVSAAQPGLEFAQDVRQPVWVMPGIEEQEALLRRPDGAA